MRLEAALSAAEEHADALDALFAVLDRKSSSEAA
jgi:hypothetical protein